MTPTISEIKALKHFIALSFPRSEHIERLEFCIDSAIEKIKSMPVSKYQMGDIYEHNVDGHKILIVRDDSDYFIGVLVDIGNAEKRKIGEYCTRCFKGDFHKIHGNISITKSPEIIHRIGDVLFSRSDDGHCIQVSKDVLYGDTEFHGRTVTPCPLFPIGYHSTEWVLKAFSPVPHIIHNIGDILYSTTIENLSVVVTADVKRDDFKFSGTVVTYGGAYSPGESSDKWCLFMFTIKKP